MFRVPDLRNKILFTLVIIALYRIGAYVPAPGLDLDAVAELKRQADPAAASSASSSCSPAARSPTSPLRARDHAVHHQLDHHADPHGGDPQARAVAADRGGRPEEDHPVDPLPRRSPSPSCSRPAWPSSSTTAAAASSAAAATHRPRPVPTSRVPRVLLVVITLTAGTALVMWMGELITQRGIGNGMSMLIFASVVSRFPSPGRQAPGREAATSCSSSC